MIFGCYGILIVLIGLGVYDRVFSWDVAEHTEEYFGKEDFLGQHTADPVLYEQIPPVGGPHARIPQACGFYSEYVFNEYAVHSLEHGAVWIAYDPSISGDDLATLQELGAQPYVLVSPYPGMEEPVSVSAWGHQMTLGSVDEGKIDAFRSRYSNNQEYSPEFGAPCGPSFTETTDLEPQQVPFVPAAEITPGLGGIDIVDATATSAVLAGATPIASPLATPAP